jgi:hypothetical protein
VPGFIARAQQSRSGFRKMWLSFSAVFQQKITERPPKIKPLLPRSVQGFIVRVQQSRSGFRKMRLYFSVVF